MITLFLIHILITLSCLWAGFIFSTIIIKNKETKPLVVYAINGLILFTLASQLAVLFMPVNIYFFSLILLILILYSVLNRKLFSQFCQLAIKEISSVPFMAKVLLGLIWLMIIVINAGPVIMDDTESYHIQAIKWIQEYGSVPGIANLHSRFGFNSSWFTSIAIFNFPQGELFTGLNGALSLWFSYYIIISIFSLRDEKNNSIAVPLLFVLALSLIIWPLIRGNVANTNYDFITTLIVFVLFIESFLKNKSLLWSPEWILWPAYLFTVRIINYPLLLLSIVGIYYLIKSGKWKLLIASITCCILLVIPFLARNVIISGYMFYPAPYFDVFNVDWKTDPQITEQLLQFIKYYNRVNTTFLDTDQTAALGSTGWIPAWFHYMYWYDKLILVPGIAGLLLAFISLFKKRISTSFAYRAFVLTAFIFCLSWFIIAPDPRFIYGWLLGGVFFLISYILELFHLNARLNKTVPVLLIAFALGIVSYTIKKIIQQPEYRNWMVPAALIQPPVKEVMIDGIVLRIPGKINNNWNARCYATPLPCLYHVDPRLKAKGKKIREGFRIEK